MYGESHGMIYLCRPCNAYVGVHKGTDKALGRLANAELRHWKKKAHRYFDILWRAKWISEGCSKREARTSGYKWLSQELDIPLDRCHIGMMDVAECIEVVRICSKYVKKYA